MVDITATFEKYLNRYQIKKRLGSGGMATVYCATDTNLHRDVAIKVMHEHLGHDSTFRERFGQEARLIAGLSHPHVVQIYDFDTITADDTTVMYMVMPMLGDETLVDVLESCRLKQATLPHERIKEIVSDLSEALDYAHSRGMVHRDVKPANILFNENNRAVLTDFGIARLAENTGLTAEGTIIGTPAYMSPEQATGSETDYRSDIYALGIILFELLTGRPPFDDDSTVSILLKHAQTPPPNVSDFTDKINPALDGVLQKALAKDPHERYQSARALKLALEEAVITESHEERYMPSPIAHQSSSTQPATVIINDDLTPEKPNLKKANDTIAATISTLVLKPAKQNPLGFATLAVALIVLLLIARLLQNQSTVVVNPTATTISEEITSVAGMAGVDSMVGDAAFFTGDFSDDDGINEYWDIMSAGSVQRSIQDGVYRISNSEPDRALTSLYDPTFIYNDVNILMNTRILESSANDASAVGIVFRYQDANNYNVFAVDGRGRFSIWRRAEGVWCELRNPCNEGDATEQWQPELQILELGEVNILNLNVYQDTITGYVNGEQVFMMEEATFDDGAIGIYMATTASGSATVEIDNFDVFQGMPPSSESMTDG